MDSKSALSSKPIAVAKKASVLSRWTIPRLPLLIGVAGLGTVVTTGTWFKFQADARQLAAANGIRARVAALESDVKKYHERFENLRWNAVKMRTRIEVSSAEPLGSWTRERARLFDNLVGRIDRSADEKLFATAKQEIEQQCARGEIDAAQKSLLRLPEIKFPTPQEFRQLETETYVKPLAEFSRQNPGYYRAFQQQEPDAAKEDIAALRADLAATEDEAITPQSMLKFELLSAVARPDDPVLADWSALVSAADYFENPDASTLLQWRNTQRAMRAQEWQTVVAGMQSILRTTVRTRQPFRAAYGRAIIRNRPDQTAAAYPFLLEAAAAGDVDARAWVANEDRAHGRNAQAQRWLEANVMDGEMTAVPQLLAIYAAVGGEATPDDGAHEMGVLQKIIVTPDAPPLAWMLLARLYDNGGAAVASPAKAFACYLRAAEQKYLPACPEVARCYLNGTGTPPDLDQARDWAARAYAAGEREKSIPILIQLMKQAPDRTAPALEELFEHVQVAAPAGFQDTRISGPSMAQHQINITLLQTLLAQYLDQKGHFGEAARLYAQSGNQDPAIVTRHAELTMVHPCETCGGRGKVDTFTPCPTCDGKGTVLCSFCDGRGYVFVPGTPPCTTCDGAGTVMQDGRLVTCAACGGTGKGKGSVIKQDCTHCNQGRVPCRDCEGGRIKVTKECPDCHGTGARALADR